MSRSATSQEVAERFPGTGGAPAGTVSPAVASPSPPTVGRPGSGGGGLGCAGTGLAGRTTGHGTNAGADGAAAAGGTVNTAPASAATSGHTFIGMSVVGPPRTRTAGLCDSAIVLRRTGVSRPDRGGRGGAGGRRRYGCDGVAAVVAPGEPFGSTGPTVTVLNVIFFFG